ncbi:MAG: serine protease [Desulfobulbaceae bacterium]|nr:serine protease [Desulfobulbaceae bacterium]
MFKSILAVLLSALLFLAHPALAEQSTKTSSNPVDISTKILGGIQSKSGDWPWMAALLRAGEPDMFLAQYCSGVLIDKSWILTAGHCVQGMKTEDIEVAVGVYDLSNFSGTRTQVKSIHLHPQYNAANLTNDIALIELSQASDQPTIPLFSGESIEDAAPTLAGRMLTAIGWGLADGTSSWYWPEKLRQVDLPVVANSYCNNIYPSPLIASQLCAGWYEGKDVCSGDSGGPVVTRIDNRWTHVGLVSYGAPCKDYFGWYGVYTRTSEFVDFIKSYVPGARFTRKPPLPWMILLIH